MIGNPSRAALTLAARWHDEECSDRSCTPTVYGHLVLEAMRQLGEEPRPGQGEFTPLPP